MGGMTKTQFWTISFDDMYPVAMNKDGLQIGRNPSELMVPFGSYELGYHGDIRHSRARFGQTYMGLSLSPTKIKSPMSDKDFASQALPN